VEFTSIHLSVCKLVLAPISLVRGVGIAGRPGFDFRQCKIFLFSTASRPALGSTQPPIQWVQWAFSPGVKQEEREADHSAPSSAEVKKGEAMTPLPHMSSWHSA
jgi:hypothetical protein